MFSRYSKRLIKSFRDDKPQQNGTGILSRNGGTSKTSRQCSGKESLPMYRPAPGAANPFRCKTCGNPQIKAFATMYAQGTSTSVSMKGFFIKHAYQKTWRQTEMAKLCAPPRKKAFRPALLFLVIAASGTFAVYVDRMPTAVSSRVMVFCFLLGWLGLHLGIYHLYWNLRLLGIHLTQVPPTGCGLAISV